MQYTIHFGLSFDDTVFPLPDTEGCVLYCGEKGLLRFFEAHLGLEGHVERVEHIRTEQYRQALRRYLKNKPTVFYHNSFEADQLACAETLLARRDELLNAGFDFSEKKDIPPRLKVLTDIEKFFTNEKRLIAGQSDRFDAVLQSLSDKTVPISTIYIHTPFHLLPSQYFRLFDILKQVEKPCNIEIVAQEYSPNYKTDLDTFKNFIDNKLPRAEKQTLKNDGTLIVWESIRDTDAAGFMARLLQLNQGFQPVFLIPDKNRVLDDALIQNGLPSFGLPSSSLGRPTLQLLKLVTAFLWKPIDPYKILEFVTMLCKPLDNDLALVIANVISQRPGIGSEQWFFEIEKFFEKYTPNPEFEVVEKDEDYNIHDKKEEKVKAVEIDREKEKKLNIEKIRKQYEFWFDRPTYSIDKAAPKDEIISIFSYLKEWASAEFEKTKNTSLLVLSEQAKRIQEFLEELPFSDKFLTYLELERIIRTIYEPAPVQPQLCQVGHYGYFHKESCLIESVETLVWWNFTDTEGGHFFSRWYKDELQYLNNQGVRLQSPQDENALMLWSRVQPIFKTDKQLILVYPKKINGEDKSEHPLMSHLRACFEDFESIVFNLNKAEDVINFKKITRLSPPKNVKLDYHRLGKTPTFVEIYSKQLNAREHETLTSLESMFYYPYQWVFRHKAKLSKSAILSIVKENTLKGNIAHRFFELVLKEDFQDWQRIDVDEWVDGRSNRLFQREAATLMMYGFEPERVQLVSQLKYAIWTLINFIRRNNWKVGGTEVDLKGTFSETPVKGKADIVLLRGGEHCVLDLKWSGHSYRERLIKNGEDLQLVLYSRLLTEDDTWAHTAYFIIENARLIARNTLAFNEVKPLLPDVDAFQMNQNIYEKMQKTFAWRIEQIKNGKVEIRTEKTVKELEEVYGEELLEVLEMRQEDAKFDDYRTLIGLVV